MTESTNYYFAWLGISDSDPDYYVLLGIERDDADTARIKQAAKVALSKLEPVTGTENREERRRLAHQIKVAFATLTNPQLRADYDHKLAAKDNQLPPPLSQPKLAIALNPAEVSSAGELKMAVPIAVPSTPSPSPSASIAVENTGKFDFEPAQVRVGFRKRILKPSRSGMPILVMIFLLFVGPVIVVGLIFYSAKSAWLGPAKPLASSTDATDRDNSSEPEISSEQETVRERDKIVGIPSDVKQPDEAEWKPALDQADPPMSEQNEKTEAQSTDVPTTTHTAVDRGDLNRVLFQQTIRRFFVALNYRDWSRSKELADRIAKMGVDTPLELARDGVHQAIEHAEGFWKQVTQSTGQLTTGVELTLGKEKVAFLEATDQYVVFKMKGIVCKAYFESIPITMLIHLGETGPVKDIPLWRLQQAAVFLATPESAREYEGGVRKLLGQSEEDGHEVESLRALLDFQLKELVLNEGLAVWPTAEQRREATELANKLLASAQLASRNVAGLRNDADKSIALALKTESPLAKFGLLDRALNDAIRLCDMRACHEVLTLVSDIYQVDMNKNLLIVSMGMIPHAPSADQAERICNMILQLSGNGWPDMRGQPTTKRELVEVKKLAKRFKLNSVLDRVELMTKFLPTTK